MELKPIGGLFAVILLMYSNSFAAQDVAATEVQPQYRAEIAAIRNNRNVQAAMDHIVAIEPQSRRDLIELTEILAPPFGGESRGRRFAEMLREGRTQRCDHRRGWQRGRPATRVRNSPGCQRSHSSVFCAVVKP